MSVCDAPGVPWRRVLKRRLQDLVARSWARIRVRGAPMMRPPRPVRRALFVASILGVAAAMGLTRSQGLPVHAGVAVLGAGVLGALAGAWFVTGACLVRMWTLVAVAGGAAVGLLLCALGVDPRLGAIVAAGIAGGMAAKPEVRH